MYQPEVYSIALLFMIISMLCWGSWANTMKLCPRYRFQLFYWDYVIGLIVGAVVWGGTLGSLGSAGKSFYIGHHPSRAASDSARDDRRSYFQHSQLAARCGDRYRRAWQLHFQSALALALVVGAIGSYLVSPKGNPLLLFGGIALVVAAIVLDAIAYRLREASRPAMSREVSSSA